jgi:hypothetical protein
MTLGALATKLRLWADRFPTHEEAADARAKAGVLDTAAAAERAALGVANAAPSGAPGARSTPPPSAAEAAWAAIENSLEISHYRRFEATFEKDAVAFVRLIEAEARIKALERWAAMDKADPDAIANAIRSGFFPALEQVAKDAMQRAAQAQQEAREQQEREAALERQRQADAREAARKAEEERGLKPRRAAEAAKAARPVAERAFPIELPGVSGWPSPQMIAIPPGKFVMGAPASEEGSGKAERPQHEVRINHAFALGQHTVTFAEWDAAVAAGAKLEKPSDGGWGRGNRPVINVNWEDAQAYLAWLNKRAGLTGRPAGRIPFAFRSGVGICLPGGDHYAVQFRRDDFDGAGQLRRQLHLRRRQEGRVSPEDHGCGLVFG